MGPFEKLQKNYKGEKKWANRTNDFLISLSEENVISLKNNGKSWKKFFWQSKNEAIA